MSSFLKKIDTSSFNIFFLGPQGFCNNRFVTRDDSFITKPLETLRDIMKLLKFAHSISKEIENRDIRLLVCNGVKASVAGGLAAKIKSKKCAWIIHDILPDNFYRKLFFMSAALFPKKIIVVSGAIKSAFTVYTREKVEIIRPFLDKEELSAMEKSVSLRRDFNIPAHAVIFASIGKILPAKGIDIFLRAFAAARRSNPDIKALITGDDKLEAAQPGYAEGLEKMAADLGIGRDVIFTGWRDDIYGVLKTADVLVHTPRRPEGFGRVLMEAMAAEKAVVAFDQGAVREIIEDGISGVLIKPFDEASLAARLSELARDPGRIKALGAEARKRALRIFSEPTGNISLFH